MYEDHNTCKCLSHIGVDTSCVWAAALSAQNAMATSAFTRDISRIAGASSTVAASARAANICSASHSLGRTVPTGLRRSRITTCSAHQGRHTDKDDAECPFKLVASFQEGG
jgi:hypothetical protein